MKFKLIASMLMMGGLLVTFQSCNKDEGNESSEGNESKTSYHADNESHNAGQNCMACHVSGGSGEGWFVVAGTVYDSNKTSVNPNGNIKLYTGPSGTGTLVANIEVDALGNFYTTSTVNFGAGLYPSVVSASGNIMYMSTKITTGQCASCHGVSTDRIWVN